jgi:2,4-diketo-3-deoxy-L-fuconate hydrolase
LINDVSARDLQFEDGQWTRAKSLDTFCPVSPLVPADSISDPQQLRIRCLLNGEVVQDSSTSEMVFSVAELIAFVSEAIELEPDDLIATGTPAGVGMARQRYLKPGDEVSIEIEGVGTLTNPLAAG